MRSDTGEARWEFEVKELLEKLKTNRETHIEEFKDTSAGYMKKLEETLTKMLSSVKKGKNIDTYIKLDKPTSHKKDYDRIIDVLEMTSASTVNLTLNEFDKYVRDNWEWTNSFKMSNETYSR